MAATDLEAVVSFPRAKEGLLPGRSGRIKVHYFETYVDSQLIRQTQFCLLDHVIV